MEKNMEHEMERGLYGVWRELGFDCLVSLKNRSKYIQMLQRPRSELP